MKVFTGLGVVVFLVIWIKYKRLSRIRKSSAEMPAPYRPLAFTTGVLDRGFILISLGFAFLFLVNKHPSFCPFLVPLVSLFS